MKEKLLKLVDLQNIDTKIFNIKKNLEKLPQELDELLGEFDPRLKKHNTNKDFLKEKEKTNLKYKMDLEDKAAKLKSLQGRLSQVQNAKELSAVDKEITGVKQDISDIEDKNIKLLDEIDNLKKEVKEEEQIIVEEQKHIDEIKQKIEDEKNKTDEELKDLEQGRKKIANTLPQELIEEYEFIFGKRESKAIVAIKGESCTGCFMSIPPQTISDVRKGFEIIHCQYCSRILYYPEWEN